MLSLVGCLSSSSLRFWLSFVPVADVSPADGDAGGDHDASQPQNFHSIAIYVDDDGVKPTPSSNTTEEVFRVSSGGDYYRLGISR